MTNSSKQTLNIKFDGDITPELVRGKDLAEVLSAFEDLIAAIVIKNEPDINKEQVKVSLIEISEGSLSTTYKPNLQALTIPAIAEVTQAISSGNITSLPHASIRSLKTIRNFTSRYTCEAHISLSGNPRRLAKITPKTEIPEPISIKGETNLYGIITRVGGKEPRIQFSTHDGMTVYCDTTEELAKEAGQRIYTQVEIYGIAEWDQGTHEILSFKIKRISKYCKIDYSEFFADLAHDYADELSHIDDASQFVHSIRADDAEE